MRSDITRFAEGWARQRGPVRTTNVMADYGCFKRPGPSRSRTAVSDESGACR
jgi:hypothetical protein